MANFSCRNQCGELPAQAANGVSDRPPGWRWREAQAQAERRRLGRPIVPLPDPVVSHAVDFLAHLDGVRRSRSPDRALADLARQFPDMLAAWQCYAHAPEQRDRLEAYIFAGVAAHRAALKCGLTMKAGLLYAQLFFDVSDHLDDKDYIVRHVFANANHRAGPAGARGQLCKWAAWQYGVAALDEILGVGGKREAVDDPAAVRRALHGLARAEVVIQVLTLARSLDPKRDAKLILQLGRQLAEQAEHDAATAVSQEARDAMTIIETLGLGTTYGGPATAVEGLPHAELRAAEELALDLGMEPPPNLASRDIRYPEEDYK
jgi:hypothetical protein